MPADGAFCVNPLRQRAPCAGLLLSAATGILASDWQPGHWSFWSLGSFAAIALCLRIHSSFLAYLSILLFFASWHDYQITTNPGYQKSRQQNLDLSEHTVTLVVQAEPKINPYDSSQRFTALVKCIDSRPSSFAVLAECTGESFRYGDELIAQGRFSIPRSSMNPGEFNYREYLARKNIYLEFRTLRGVPAEIAGHDKGNPFIAVALSLRHRLAETLQWGLEDDPEVAETIQGLVLGGRSETSIQLKQLFQETGTIHLFAASGLQVGLFAGLVWTGTRSFGLPRRWATFAIASILSGYCAMTGFYPATVRATVTAVLLAIGFAVERPVAVINSLCASGLLILLHDTQELFLIGFELSFAAVLAIVVAAGPLGHLLSRGFQPDPFLPRQLLRPWQRFAFRLARRACESLSLCLVCWAATLPILALREHRIPLIGTFANLIVVPLASAVMLLGVVAMLGGSMFRTVAILINNASWLLTKSILWVLRAAAAIPLHCVNFSPAAILEHDRITILSESSELVLHVHEKGHDWLFNAGTPSQWNRITEPYLKSEGINRIDKIIFCVRQPIRHETLESARRCFEIGEVVPATGEVIRVQLGRFHVLVLPEVGKGTLEALPHEAVDVVVCGRLRTRRMPMESLIATMRPDLVICPGKKTGGFHEAEQPLFLYPRREGSITAEISGDNLVVHTFCGSEFRFTSRRR